MTDIALRPPQQDTRPRILIVDDDEEFCREFQEMLESSGYHAAYCCDPDAVPEAERRFSPHAAFIDLGLRGADGLHVAWQLTMASEDLLLFAMSGSRERLRRAVRERSCIAGFLDKPFDRRTLTTLLQSDGCA
jgi:DNA-binding response OmpR family regulator